MFVRFSKKVSLIKVYIYSTLLKSSKKIFYLKILFFFKYKRLNMGNSNSKKISDNTDNTQNDEDEGKFVAWIVVFWSNRSLTTIALFWILVSLDLEWGITKHTKKFKSKPKEEIQKICLWWRKTSFPGSNLVREKKRGMLRKFTIGIIYL
jgi:hypothetical protein